MAHFFFLSYFAVFIRVVQQESAVTAAAPRCIRPVERSKVAGLSLKSACLSVSPAYRRHMTLQKRGGVVRGVA